jgi:hypothetical protein
MALAAVGLLLPRPDPPATATRTGEPHTGLAWGRRAPAVLAGFGWLLTIAYCAGVLSTGSQTG